MSDAEAVLALVMFVIGSVLGGVALVTTLELYDAGARWGWLFLPISVALAVVVGLSFLLSAIFL